MKKLGTILWIGAGIVLWFFMISSFYHWWSVGGVIAGIIFVPGVVAFPLIYWLEEGVFPVMYFIIWAIGIGGLFIANNSSKE